MRSAIELIRHERRAAVFFAALTQSALGNGAGYVALLLIAYSRFESPWAISIVLLADLVPAMLLGPVFGAVADRFSRRACVVAADLLRAGAFTGIALVDSFEVTVALAVIAGTGTALFTPAALASLPSLVERRRLPAATSVYGAISDLGYTAGPALAGAMLLLGGAEAIMAVNGATFALSAVVLALLRFGAAPAQSGTPAGGSILRAAAEGFRSARALPGVPTILVASSLAFFFVGLFNVAELLFAREVLGTSEAGFSLLVAVFGVGFIAGSLAGAEGGVLPELKRRYLLGLALMGAGFLASGLAPSVAIAAGAFLTTGFGNGLVLVYERLLFQATVSDALAGRVFGIKDSLAAWAFGIAFLVAGGLIELTDVRAVIVCAGVGGLVAWVAAIVALRNVWNEREEEVPAAPLGGSAHAGRAGGAEPGRRESRRPRRPPGRPPR